MPPLCASSSAFRSLTTIAPRGGEGEGGGGEGGGGKGEGGGGEGEGGGEGGGAGCGGDASSHSYAPVATRGPQSVQSVP